MCRTFSPLFMLCHLSQAYISLQPVLLRVAPLELDTRYVITTTQAATQSCNLRCSIVFLRAQINLQEQ